MKHLAAVSMVAALLASTLAQARQPDAESVKAAVDAANSWLVLADAGDGNATWEQAAPAFRAALGKAAWADSFRQARQPFGAVSARTLRSSEFKRKLPGAPDGEYVLIQYDTSFANKAHAIETVVPMRDKDGSWKVSGYFVK